jgi:hypothetical protein
MARKSKLQYESESEEEKPKELEEVEEEVQEIEVPKVIKEKKPRTQKLIDATNNMTKAVIIRT